MSGIVGVFNFDGAPVDRELLTVMTRRMAYRGPDAQTVWVEGNVGLGHALYRTCEADIPQPFTFEHIVITAHIRIDGREDLVLLLQGAGIRAATSTPDVELLAKAYLAWGEDCLKYLLGDFTFILWDAQKQKVFAARDHFGIQPLLYAHVGSTLILSSEIGSIRRHPLVSSTLNDQAIGDFLVAHNIRWIDRTQTAFADIARVAPAHKVVGTREQRAVQRYWLPPIDEPLLYYRTEDEYVEHFLELFKKAVKDRMRSKRILLSLSGGLDSSSIAVMASRLVQSGEVDAELNALTIGYDRIHPDTEGYYARLVARKLGIHHDFFPADNYPVSQPLPLLAEPSTSLQSGFSEAVDGKIHSLAQTGLLGHGGDENLRPTPLIDILKGLSPLAGAALIRWQWRYLGKPPSGLRAVFNIRNWIKRSATANFGYPIWLNPEFERRMGLRERFQRLWDWRPPRNHPIHPGAYKALLWPDWQMSGEPLREPPVPQYVAACPFLDIRLTRFVLTLPPQPWFQRKYLLRRAMQDALPEEILARKKTPLGDLVKSVINQPGTEWVNDWKPVPELAQYVRRDAVPPLVGTNASRTLAVDLRPLWLNEWLSQYRDL